MVLADSDPELFIFTALQFVSHILHNVYGTKTPVDGTKGTKKKRWKVKKRFNIERSGDVGCLNMPEGKEPEAVYQHKDYGKLTA